MLRSRRWLAGAVAILIQLGSTSLGRLQAATTPTPSRLSATWNVDTSAVQLPIAFQGHEFLRIFGELARTQPTNKGLETPEQFRTRMAAWGVPQTWLAFRIDEHLSMDYGPDSQVVSCRIDLKPALTTDKASAGATAMILHTEFQPGRSYSAHDARGMTLRINAGNRDVQGLLLVTNDGEVARSPIVFDRAFPVDRIQGAPGPAPLRAYAVCRVTALGPEHRAVVDQESYTEPRPGLPVRLHNRLRYLCVHVASVWFVDPGTGTVVHKERFDPLD